MKDKTKQLADQAGFMLWDNESWNPGDVVDWSARYDNELQRFADLIVLECIDYCGENLSKTVGGALKIHFGVEE
jgi:hypothetical protein